MGVTVYDIARIDGVSRSTVCRALWDKGRISAATRARIKKIAAEMNYRPNDLARDLSTGRTRLVGVVADSTYVPEFRWILEPVEEGLREAGYSMLFYTARDEPEVERVFCEDLLRKRVSGVIAFMSSSKPDRQAYRDLVNAGVKLVVVGDCVDHLDALFVVGDDYQVGRLVTEHLISLGHRRIANLAIPQTSYIGRERMRGFRDAMEDAGVPITASNVVETGFSEEDGARAAVRLLRRRQPPTAIIARHDAVAIGAMRAIFSAGLSVPEDVSVVGNANISVSDVLRAPLTTISYPGRQMAAIGINKLLDVLAGRQVDTNPAILGVELVVRSSTAPPRDGTHQAIRPAAS